LIAEFCGYRGLFKIPRRCGGRRRLVCLRGGWIASHFPYLVTVAIWRREVVMPAAVTPGGAVGIARGRARQLAESFDFLG